METLRRLYVGGLSPLVSKAELEERFGKFGKIDDVDIVYRKDVQGNLIKAFAYLNIHISDVDLKKCISVLNKTKWKGRMLQIEKAKESFLNRLSKERQEAKEKEKANAPCFQNDLVLSLEKAGVMDFQMKTAVPGTEVPNHKHWVVSKFGRVLPVLHLNGKKQSKMKYDPSKYCHNIKKIDDTFKLVPVSQLTWQLEDDEICRKRRGVFPILMSPRKKRLLNPTISGGYKDTQMDQRIPLASIGTAERLSHTKKKCGHLANKSSDRMIDEYDTEEELQAALKREAVTRGTVKYAEDCNIEVVDDSSETSYTMHWSKPKATPKLNYTCYNLDDREYESDNTDEIITVARTLQKKYNFKTKTETVRTNKFNQLKKQERKEGSTFSQGTKDECKSPDTEMSKPESDSETSASEDDSSSFYSDEEYKAMMQNPLKLDLTMGDLETLAKEANEFENDDETVNYNEYDSDINAKQGYGVAKNLLASGSEIPALEKKQNAYLASTAIKKKLKTENIQRVLQSGRQSNNDESGNSDSEFHKHSESINIICHRENVKIEALKPKSRTALQCLVNNHELKKKAKGETDTSEGHLGFENVKTKRGIEPEDIVGSILVGESSCGQQPKCKKDTPVKPPAFKGLSSVSASTAPVKSRFGLSTISSVENAAVTKISNDIKLSNYGSKQTKRERQEPPRDLKLVFLEAKSKIRSSSSDISEDCSSDLSCTSSVAKTGILQISTAMEETTPEVKQQRDNQKRLVAVMERRKELELQKQIIQGALLQLDSKCSKKRQHFVFNSDSASEKEEEASTSERKSMFSDNKAKQGTSKLFNSSEEDSDNDHKEDNERFEVKAQYEGRSGMKLMQLQSHFGTDERFKMDSRFLESNSEDEEASEAHKSKGNEEYDLSLEKKKNLGILQSILNINVEPQPASQHTAKGKQFKDLNFLHYDPAKEDHATFETKAEEKQSKSKRMKKRLEAEKLPEVSNEIFHEIIMDFREVFGTSKTQKTKKSEITWDQELEKNLQALEDEKQKIAREVQMLQKEKNNRERSMSVPPTWNSLKLSVMIQEANTISAKLQKHTVFSRHEVADKENLSGNSVQIQVRNLKLGIVTFWNLDKFEYKLAAMKDLYENRGNPKEDDMFYDPADEWEPDLSKSSLSNFSRRRSKSLMKNKRISGCLYEIRVHPIQSLQSGYSSGLMTKSSSFLSKSNSVCSNGNDSHLPEICKDLIACALDYLGQSRSDESSIADSLVSCIETVCKGVHVVSRTYDQQDEDSTDGMFVVNREAQIQSIKLTSAFQQSVVLTKHWLDSFTESQETDKPADNLMLNIRKLGGYLQLLLQGCRSDISAMVTEAKAKAGLTVEQLLQDIGCLAALTDTQLHLPKEEWTDTCLLQKSFIDTLNLGFCVGLKNLIENGIQTADLMQTEIRRCAVHDKVLEEMKNTSFKLAGFFSNSLADCKKINLDLVLKDSAFSVRTSLSSALRNIKSCLNLLQHTVTSLLKGTDTDTSHILTSLNDIHSSASILNKIFLSWSQHIFGLVEFRKLSETLISAVQKRSSSKANYAQPQDAQRNSVFSPTKILWV